MKNKTTALILSIFVGELGIDRFYLGYIGIGLLSFIFGILLSNYLLKNKISIINSDNFRETSNSNPQKLDLFEKYSKNELIIIGFVALGILLQIINIALLGGIPLFSATLKAKAATKIWLLSYIIFLPSINILLARYNRQSHYMLLFIG